MSTADEVCVSAADAQSVGQGHAAHQVTETDLRGRVSANGDLHPNLIANW
jgi:hypothetical protein